MKNYYKYIILYFLIAFLSCSDGGSGDGQTYQYLNPDEINLFLDEIQSHYPDIAKIETVGTSESGREIKALIISDNPEILEGEPAVRLTGGIHGNEKMGVELLVRFIEYLTSNYTSADPTVRDLVNSRYICIIPVLNPDGLARNRRYNDNNVDLNRNFNSTGLSLQSETKAIQDYSSGKGFNLSITYHTGAVLVNMPFDYGSELLDGVAPVENSLVKKYALTYTDGNGSKFLTNPDVFNYVYNSIYAGNIYLDRGTINGGDWYVALGTLQDWSYTQTGCLDLTVEISKRNPSTEEGVEQVFIYNRDSLMAYIEEAGESVHGRVTDSSGDPAANTEIKVSWNDSGETVYSDIIIKTDINGYYNRMLLPGTYEFSFIKPGYPTVTQNVVFTIPQADPLNITLQIL